MSPRREITAFALVLAALVAGFLGESLFGGKVLSPADVLFVSASFRDVKGPDYEPANRLLTDPVLQFQPWLEFNRAMFRRGRLPLWNDQAGCGVPHLANSQNAAFDPFHLIAYLGPLPASLPWIMAARLWVAGLGMFVLARSWGFGGWGRWFAGLTFPFCGFLVVWLLYPVTAAAIWMPWLFWASDRVLERPEARRVGVLGLIVGCVFLGGHVQTSAHVLLATGLYVAWRVLYGFQKVHARCPMANARCESGSGSLFPSVIGHQASGMNFPGCVLRDAGKGGPGRTAAWTVGVALGLTIASVSIVPLWVYLGKSPVWADREHERPSPWRLTRPRVLDTVCTAVPYAFGSQRRGQPNLARAVGVHNLNESAGGFAGLATLIWLAPQAWRARRGQARIAFLASLTAFGFLGAFGFPPVVNLLRATPILNVMDQRRLTLWVAFGLVLLGGAGLDRIADPGPRRGALWVAGAVLLCLASFAAQRSEPWLRSRAEAHYARAAETTIGADASLYARRADRQIRQALDHLPRQLWLTAAELSALAAWAVLAQRGLVGWSSARLGLLGLTLVELLGFGYGLNPAIDPDDDRPVPEAIARLRDGLGRSGRLIGLGEEMPPNVAMRYGLADARAYDSVELTRNVDWLEPLYEPGGPSRSSRRAIAWSGVCRARERLREAGVAAVLAATPPPADLPAKCERVGSVWIAWLDAEPIVSTMDKEVPTSATVDDGRIDVSINCARETRLIVRQTFDPGWRAEVDGQPAEIVPRRGAFLSVRVARGPHRVRLEYDPPEVRAALLASLAAIAIAVFALTGFRPIRSTRIPVLGLGPSRALGLESGRDLFRNSRPAYH